MTTNLNWKCLLLKLLVILVLVFIFYKLTKNRNEGFETEITSENSNSNTVANSATNGTIKPIEYINLNETYLEDGEGIGNTSGNPDGASLNLLYANYSGVEKGKAVWEDKTLDQCIDTCNQLENCIGFSRDLVNDDAPAKCYPRTKLENCHSSRKGDMNQIQNAIKFNSYIKNTIPDILNKCIGDPELTLNRSIFIKSRKYPKKYIGSDNGVAVLVEDNDPDIMRKCNFRLEVGKDGIGTIAFYHIDSGKYLYRQRMATLETFETMPDPTMTAMANSGMVNSGIEILGLKDVMSNKTEDKLRVSFNILDGMKNMMKFRCVPLDGETIDRFITINPDNNKYLICNTARNIKMEEDTVFMITDSIQTTKIIKNQNNLTSNTTTTKRESFNNNTLNSSGGVMLDKSANIPLYKNLMMPDENMNVANYVQDNYISKSSPNNFVSISKKLDDNILSQQLANSMSKNQDKYEMLNNLNQEIEKEIAMLNMDVNGKNDTLANNLDRMRISDMSTDYFALKSAYKLPL